MTFCVAVKVREGLVGLADTRIVRGSEQTRKSKLARLEHGAGSIFLMSSGLRSVRDKTFLYFEEALAKGLSGQDGGPVGLRRMHQAASLFGQQLRRVRDEDGRALSNSGFVFNLHAILGGRLDDDPDPALFYVYPEGNWVEATEDAPYHIIGRTSYGRPILDRLLTADMGLGPVLALAFLAFDATRASVTDVDFPIDVAVLPAQGSLSERRFDSSDLARAGEHWCRHLRAALDDFPLEWAAELLEPGVGRHG